MLVQYGWGGDVDDDDGDNDDDEVVVMMMMMMMEPTSREVIWDSWHKRDVCGKNGDYELLCVSVFVYVCVRVLKEERKKEENR